MSIAQTILGQIKAVDPRAIGAWGAKDFVNTGLGLRFKTTGLVRWKGYVHVVYDEGADLYNVEFLRVRAGKVKRDKVAEGIFAEQLVDVIDEQVG